MLKMNKCLLIASSLLFVVLTVEGYCSCKCDTPEIPYTRVPYVPSLPHIPYKYVSADISQASVNNYLYQPPSPNHRPSYTPVLIVPQTQSQQTQTQASLHDAQAHSSIDIQRKELILQDVGHVSPLQHFSTVPRHQSVISGGYGQTSASVSHDNTASTQTLVHLGHQQSYQHVQTGGHVEGGYHGRHLGHQQAYQHVTSGGHDEGGYHGGHVEHQQATGGNQDQHDDDGHHKKNPNIHYRYAYAVNDHKTGDIKKHQEERHGDDVVGEYSLVEDDGNVRTVKYRADWKTGFHAQVTNSKPRHHG